jgi:hypothetical protein
MATATPPPVPTGRSSSACPSISHRLERSTVLSWAGSATGEAVT